MAAYRTLTMVTCVWALPLAIAEAGTTGDAAPGAIDTRELPGFTKTLNLADLIRTVPELRHPLRDRPPILCWGEPLPSFSDPVRMKAELAALKRRGVALWVGVSRKGLATQVAAAQAIAKAGGPVHLLVLGGCDLYRKDRSSPLLRHAKASTAKAHVGHPCLVLTSGWQRAADYVHRVLKPFADAKLPVAGVWYDYEGWPYPWNGVFEANGACPECRKAYPPGVLDNRESFIHWAFCLRDQALDTALARPVRKLFPKAWVGNYSSPTPSTDAHPCVMALGCRWPSTPNTTAFNVIQPSLYASENLAKRYFNADWALVPELLDAVYFCCLLRGISNVHHNLRPDQILMPYVTDYCASRLHTDAPRMSGPAYRELLRHMMLRGARGFWCFNPGPPYKKAAQVYDEITHVVAVYNEMLAYRDLLDHGTVMNDAVPDPCSPSVAWSGMRLKDEALVRVVSLGQQASHVDIVPFLGRAVRLLAPPTGRTYRIAAAGAVRAVD